MSWPTRNRLRVSPPWALSATQQKSINETLESDDCAVSVFGFRQWSGSGCVRLSPLYRDTSGGRESENEPGGVAPPVFRRDAIPSEAHAESDAAVERDLRPASRPRPCSAQEERHPYPSDPR